MSKGGSQEQVPDHFEEGEGMFVRLPDGSTYFFRKEILDACKVTEEQALKFADATLEGTDEVSGFGFNVMEPSVQVANVSGRLQPSSSSLTTDLASRPRTVMCPW